jgi:hypothetical protein
MNWGIQILAITLAFLSVLSNGQELQNHGMIDSIFNDKEIQDLEIILNFFNEEICSLKTIEQHPITQCYLEFCQRLKTDAETTGAIDTGIPFERQNEVYQRINDATFVQIWTINKSWIPNTTDTLRELDLNPGGKYAEFLFSLGKEFSEVNEYVENLMALISISPSMKAEFLMNYNNFDLSDQRIRLLFAIHYLTINDQQKRVYK